MFNPDIFIHTAHAAEAAPSGDVIATFGLNWKIFIAQLINFSIVLLILWRWVFKPVTAALKARSNTIQKSLDDAAQIETDKQKFESWKTAQMTKTRQEAAGIITQAKQEATVVKTELLNQTKQEQERLVAQTQAKLEQEKKQALTDVTEQVADMVISATEKILQEKIDPRKDKELIKRALEQV